MTWDGNPSVWRLAEHRPLIQYIEYARQEQQSDLGTESTCALCISHALSSHIEVILTWAMPNERISSPTLHIQSAVTTRLVLLLLQGKATHLSLASIKVPLV